jgi:sugar phosphate isomerase/epimerase
MIFRAGLATLALTLVSARPAPPHPPDDELLAPERLHAWCVVPFDARRRGPEARAAMLPELGIRRLAYDWRAEHVPTFDAEVAALRAHGVELVAWWFPPQTDGVARVILDCLRRHDLRIQLWVSLGDPAPGAPAEEKIAAAAARLAPLADAAAEIGCTLGLYNHGGWFGEPENQLRVLRALNRPQVGLVYNFHHGHAHLDRFPAMWEAMRPHVLAVNLNGMERPGDTRGRKILTLGEGTEEVRMLRVIRDSGWRGPIGLLDHRMETDSAETLRAELAGLQRVREKLASGVE